MKTTYDSIFTDKIVFGNTSNTLNNKFWINLPLNKPNNSNSISPNNGSFFIVKTFSSTDSDKIIKGILSKKNVFFDNNGNLEIDDDSGNIVLKYKNILTTADFSKTNKGNIFVDLSTNNPINLLRNDLIFSKNKYWMLYTKDNICYILYNPLHRQSFKNLYNKQSFDSSGATNTNLNFIFNQYCEIASLQNDTNLKRSYTDNTCNCIRLDDCIDDATGIHSSNLKYRNSIGLNCVCAAPSCDAKDVSNTSFMFKDGSTGFKDRVIKNLPNSTCPSIQNVICTAELSGAGNVNLVGSKISQQCGDSTSTNDTSVPTTTSAPTTTTPNSTTSAPTTTIYNPLKYVANLSIFITADSSKIINNQDFKDQITNNVLKLDKTLKPEDITIEITEFYISENSYKIDIILNKSIQIMENTIISSIITPNIVDNFNISKSKNFENTDITTTTKPPEKTIISNEIIIIIIIVFVVLILGATGYIISR